MKNASHHFRIIALLAVRVRLPGRDHHRQGFGHHGHPRPAVGGGLHVEEAGRHHPGDRRRLRHRDLGPHQRDHRHRQRLEADEALGDGQAETTVQFARGGGQGREGRPVGLRARIQPGEGAHARAGEGHLHRQGQQLEGGRRCRRQDHPVQPREQLRHVRLLQGARARERGLSRHARRTSPAPPPS